MLQSLTATSGTACTDKGVCLLLISFLFDSTLPFSAMSALRHNLERQELTQRVRVCGGGGNDGGVVGARLGGRVCV